MCFYIVNVPVSRNVRNGEKYCKNYSVLIFWICGSIWARKPEVVAAFISQHMNYFVLRL